MFTKEEIARNIQLDVEWVDFLIDCLDMPLNSDQLGEWSKKYADTVLGLKKLFGPIAKWEASHPSGVYAPTSDGS